MSSKSSAGHPVVMECAELPQLFNALLKKGYQVVGPTVREGAIVYEPLQSIDELPVGWAEEQGAGLYRLKKRSDQALFGYTVGPHTWRRLLFPPVQRLFGARRESKGFQLQPNGDQPSKYALFGVRACELQALAMQDKVLLGGSFVDPIYQRRRREAFLVAVNCGQGGGTCFCASLKTGPKVSGGYDLALTEVLEGRRHYFLVETGSEAGARMLAGVPHRPANAKEMAAGREVWSKAARQMGRRFDPKGLPELFARNYESPRWDEVAGRCLSCANCTMVCPTCFCTTVEEVTDLTGDQAERWRKWDSCFTVSFTHVVGGSARASVRARYRQWLTHKLGTWVEQFGTSGCVGCGRCITWCPVGIDLTEEVRALRESEGAKVER